MKKWGYKLVDLLYPIKTTLIYEIQCNKVKMLTTKKKSTEKGEGNQIIKLGKKVTLKALTKKLWNNNNEKDKTLKPNTKLSVVSPSYSTIIFFSF